MTATLLDSNTALVVIDLQKGILAFAASVPTADVIRNAAALASAFRALKKTVMLVNVAGGAPGRTERPRLPGNLPPDWADLLPELNAQPDDLRATKRSWGAFSSTDIDAQLKARGVTQIVLCGISTSIGVETTAREAYSLGYNVTLATDAMTDLDPAAHENSVSRIFPRLGETATSAEIVALLGGSA